MRYPTFRQTLCSLLLLAPHFSVCAGSLEFRSEGFFASQDTEVKLFREPWRTDLHLDVNGKHTISIVGPVLRPGYNNLSYAETKTENDPARRRMIDSGVISKLTTPCSRTFTEYKGGMLMRLDYGLAPAEVTKAMCRFLLPVEIFANRRARWTGGETVLPLAKPERNKFFFLNDPKGAANQFRIDLGNGTELGVKYLSRIKSVSLSDCREWNESNYHLVATFEGRSMLIFMCLLKPQEPFPEVEAPQEQPSTPEVKVVEQGAVFSALSGEKEITVAKSGQIQVRRKGEPVFNIEPPNMTANGVHASFAEPVSFDVKNNRVDVVSKVKDKPFILRQSLTMEDDGWLSVSAAFEGIRADTQGTQVELLLPAKTLAGKTMRVDERFISLPKEPAASEMLVDSWDGKVLNYDLPEEGADRVALICDLKAKTFLKDYRKWNQQCFKIGMFPKDNVLKYRLHFWKEEGSPPPPVKGNLLRDGASFEVGPEGVRPFCCYSWNEKMVEPGIPPVFDATTAVHGTTSLRFAASDSIQKGSPRGFAYVGAVFNRVPLKRDHKYTVSAWMKADRPGIKGALYCGETTWSGEDWLAFPVTTEWKRYHFTFCPSDFKKSGYFLTWAGLASECKEGTLWIDAVQLEEGDLSDFQPAAQVEYGVESTSKEKLFESRGPCAAVLRVRNNGKKPLAEKVQYVIKNYWEQVVRSGTIPISVPPETTAAYPVNFGKLPIGYYRGYFTAPTSERKELIFGVYQPQPLTPLPDDWPLACHNDPTPLVRKIGFGSVRAFEIFEFSDIAPEKGKFTFERADRMVEQAQKCGLTIMPILGDFRWPSYRPQPPVPIYAQKEVNDNVVEGSTVRMAWPTTAAWKDYIRAVTSRYKGKINYWEILNEPNLEMTSQQYVPYLQAAYEAAKEGNPFCKVVGVCATSDFAGKPDSFTDGVFALGATKFFDLLSVHLYDSKPPEETLGAGSDKLIQKWRQTLKEKYGKDASVWHTEKSYIPREMGYSMQKNNVPVEYCDEPQFLIDTFKNKAEYMIRETLLDAVSGKGGRFFWFGVFDYESCFISIRPFQPYGLNHTEIDQSPCPELIAANGLARALDGMSHPFRQLAPGDTVYCCVFTGEKGSVAALWDWKKKSRIVIPVGTAPFVLRNFFGEPIPCSPNAKGELVVELDGAPKYLSLPKRDGEACCKMFGLARAE